MEETKLDYTKADVCSLPEYEPPVGDVIVKPHKTILQFWPAQNPDQYRWIEPIEQRHLLAFGQFVAQIMGVDLINDQQYSQMPEQEKARCCSVVLTRHGLDRQDPPGIFRWNPIVVVVKYCVMMALRCSVDMSNQKFTPHDCLMWDLRTSEYMLVYDGKNGHLSAGPMILNAIERWAEASKLAAWIPQQGPKPEEIIKP